MSFLNLSQGLFFSVASVGTPNDFGPIYLETDMSRFPVEPWNTASNLIFLIIVVYWSIKTKMIFRRHSLLTVSLPILFIGYIGGTVYHATRSHDVWLIMDFVPISVLCLMVSYTYWHRLLQKHLRVFLFAIMPYATLRGVISRLGLEKNMMISMGYGLLGFFIAVPLGVYALKRRVQYASILLATISIFILALFFRILDSHLGENLKSIFYMGTHWLWHMFGGMASHFLILFVYRDDLAISMQRTNGAKIEDSPLRSLQSSTIPLSKQG